LDPTTLGRGYFNDMQVHRILDEHRANRRDNSKAIWTLLMLELWHREFIDAGPGTGAGGLAESAASPAQM
jgi:asparagine synthase (glutamine-hydrolysing)